MAFEGHVAAARRQRGLAVPPEWYAQPVFYFSNPASLYRHGEPVARPSDTRRLDYELELAAVIGEDGRIAGFTVMNDLSARDLQFAETPVGLGPAKGKDFATVLGPVLVPAARFTGDPDLRARAWVNGELRTDSRTGGMHFSWDALLAAVARNTRGLQPGDVIGSGTVPGGCILEHGDGRWLEPGDVVELEIEGIGRLRTPIV
jgi:fumarylacetoacetate (FAA) hydrolase